MKSLIRNISQIPGWRTNRKIVVIESDDWGSVRMASSKAFQSLLKAGIPVDKDLYSMYDSLESKDDLSALFDTLKKFKDKNGQYPIITANTIVANPDFEKIKESDFTNYYYELFTETLNRYNSQSNTFNTWVEGISEGFFRPQYHGREHVNVDFWMSALQAKDSCFFKAFEYQIFGINGANKGRRNNFMATLDFNTAGHLERIKDIFREGLHLFEQIFQYKSTTFIAPCYVWNDAIETVAATESVRAIQGIPYQYIPALGQSEYQKKLHFTGNKNKAGQKYLVRNVFFEPTLDGETFSINKSLKRIENAFFWRKPAIIGTHRINFIGSLVEENRTKNLASFKLLLSSILKKWPDVEFMSSDQLAILIN